MSTPTLTVDIALIGGGIAGLWLLHRLRQRGYSVLLFEAGALGGGQTIHCQGILHGGLKYRLDGAGGGAGAELAAMPGAWRDCLAGRGDVDLRRCRVLSETMHLWTDGALPARLAGAIAAGTLRASVNRLAAADYPLPLRSPHFHGSVYCIDEPVLDIPSLLAALVAPHRDVVHPIDWRRARLARDAGKVCIDLPECRVSAQQLVLTSGAGNQHLIGALGGAPAMRRRPLQQVLLQHAGLPPLFAHCLGRGSSPRLTITTHRDSEGAALWYLGGDLAVKGASLSPAQLLARARQEVAGLLPWLPLRGARWSTLALDRAEATPRSAGGAPGGAHVAAVEGADNVLAVWPTKLALCPQLGRAVERQLARRGIAPRHPQDPAALPVRRAPPIARPRWEIPAS